MIKKCIGCGEELQSINSEKLGYIRKDKYEDSVYCENCFKYIHYGKPKKSENHIDYQRIIKDINHSKTPVIYVIDVLNIINETIKCLNVIESNKKIIVLTKFDLLPKSVKPLKIIKYFKENYYKDCEIFCVSSKKNHNIENVIKYLKKEKIKKAYIVGETNAGKSSFLNSVLSLNKNKSYITTSPIPNTTTSYLNIEIDGIEYIDTPGFELRNSIYKFLDSETLRLIQSKKQIKIKTFQVKAGTSLIINNFLRIDYLEGHLNSINFYMNENIKYKKVKTSSSNELITLSNKTFKIEKSSDVVIPGLGFAKINKPGIVKVYSLDEDIIMLRNKMI